MFTTAILHLSRFDLSWEKVTAFFLYMKAC